MRRLSTLVLFCMILFSSCHFAGGKKVTGNGVMTTQKLTIDGFRGIEVAGPYDVFVSQGQNYEVRVEGDENLLEYLELEVDGDVLEIGSRRGYNLKSKVGIKVYVTTPLIEHLAVAGSGNIRSQTKVTSASALDLSIAGSGDMLLGEVDAPKIDAEIAGSGSVTVKGTTRALHAEIAGSGSIHALDLLSESVDVEIAGSGNAEVFASKQLDASIAGSGDVKYRGNPSVSKSKAGSGDVRKVN